MTLSDKAGLDSGLTCLKGAGPARTALLSKLGLCVIRDLLFFFPRRYEDRRHAAAISGLAIGAPAVVFARVVSSEARELQGRARRIVTCRFSDGTGELQAVWFNMRGLENILKKGTEAVLFGTPLLHGNALEMTSPEFSVSPGDAKNFTGIIPVYPLTEGLTQKWMRAFTASAVEKYSSLLKEPLPHEITEQNSLMPLNEAVLSLHRPPSPESWKEARRRIAYEELFFLQGAMICSRSESGAGGAVTPDIKTAESILFGASFTPTESQLGAVREILEDASHGRPARRLLQGDVGCGKSVAAAAFAGAVCAAGAQCAMLAPTEVLAEQLNGQMRKYLEPKGFRCALLTSSVSPSERKEIAAGIASGEICAAAGTHSLLSEDIAFKNLGALIIDEQQRFGVSQRSLLISKYPSAHLLMMSATPIPRTAALALYGDLDITSIRELPKGRRAPETRLITYKKLPDLMRFLISEIAAGGRVYWICPLVDDGESALPTVKKRWKWLQEKLPPVPVSLIYGQQESRDKLQALDDFRSGRTKILVGTTVLEVGIDVPEASVIVVESPERYGMSQLHQLRGRVGRGQRRGVCVLLGESDTGAERPRLETFAAVNDGFRIAEADLALRGAGDMAGTAQHGDISFKAANLQTDSELCSTARADAAAYENKYGTEALRALIEKLYMVPASCESRFF